MCHGEASISSLRHSFASRESRKEAGVLFRYRDQMGAIQLNQKTMSIHFRMETASQACGFRLAVQDQLDGCIISVCSISKKKSESESGGEFLTLSFKTRGVKDVEASR